MVYSGFDGANKKLKIVTVNIPIPYLEHIEYLRQEGFTPSRSEYVRWAVGNQITRDLEREERIKELQDKRQPVKVIIPKGWDYIEGFNDNKPFQTQRLEIITEEKEVFY